jgi:hypothetical protein
MTPPESAALAELDRLGASAATAVLERMNRLVDLDPLVVHLDGQPPAGRLGTARRRRWALPAAAAVVLVAGAVAAILLERDRQPSVTSGQPQYFLPGWLPDGVGPEPDTAVSYDDVASGEVLRGEIVVYGAASADDPWAGALVSAVYITPDPSELGDESDGDLVDIGGRQATLSQDDRGWSVEWSVDGGRLVVGGVGLDRDEVLQAAAAASVEPGVEPAGLPADFVEIARGPLDAAEGAWFVSTSGVALSYTVERDQSGGEQGLAIVQRPGSADAVDLVRLSYPDSDRTTVRGHAAVVRRSDDGLLLQWYEPGGTLITVLGSGVAEDVVRRVAEQLQPADAAEIERLTSAPALSSGFGGLDDGQVVVASGTQGETEWRLVAGPEQVGQLQGLSYEETMAGSGSGSSSGSGGSDEPGAATPVEAAVVRTMDDSAWAVYGLVAGDASVVSVETADGSVVDLPVYAVEGWERRVFVGFVPVASDSDMEAVVVVPWPDGSEIGRQPIVLNGDAPSPITPSDGDEECVTEGDGTIVCESGGVATATSVP